MTVSYSTDDGTGVKTATFTGTGALTGATALLSGATVAIIVGYSSIGATAFNQASALTSITIPASVTSIGSSAFNGASALTSITIPASVTSIGAWAFYNASSLTSITIPASVTSIGTNAFRSASALTTITFDADSSLISIGENAFYQASALTSIIIPASVTTIGNYAFRQASALTSIIIPASVTTIGNYAFRQASALTTVTFEAGSSLISIGNGAFYNSSVTTVIASQDLIDNMNWSTTDFNTIGGKSGITVELQPPTPAELAAAAAAAVAATPTCFPAGTPVTTDQGLVAIEKLNTDKHTIRGKEIVAITQSRPLQKHIVCFEKDSLSKNVPSQQTLCSMEHKVFYKGEMTKARNLVDLCENVTFVPYTGETLYNVLLKKQDKMMINNLICETLDPKNIMAKISTMKDGQKKNKAICQLTKIIKENNVPEYQKLYASL